MYQNKTSHRLWVILTDTPTLTTPTPVKVCTRYYLPANATQCQTCNSMQNQKAFCCLCIHYHQPSNLDKKSNAHTTRPTWSCLIPAVNLVTVVGSLQQWYVSVYLCLHTCWGWYRAEPWWHEDKRCNINKTNGRAEAYGWGEVCIPRKHVVSGNRRSSLYPNLYDILTQMPTTGMLKPLQSKGAYFVIGGKQGESIESTGELMDYE